MQQSQQKVSIWAFRGDPICIVHVFLNALDMDKLGYEIAIIFEGEATKLIKTYHDEKDKAPFYNLYSQVKEKGLIKAVCRACATKMGAVKEAEAEGLPLVDSMSGHPPMSEYTENGYKIITI